VHLLVSELRKWKNTFQITQKNNYYCCPSRKLEEFSFPEAWSNSIEAYVHNTSNLNILKKVHVPTKGGNRIFKFF